MSVELPKRSQDDNDEMLGLVRSIHLTRFKDGVVDATESITCKSNTWKNTANKIVTFVGDDAVAIYHASESIRAIRETFDISDVDLPEISYLNIEAIARKSIQVPSYTLPWVCTALHLDSGEVLENHARAAEVTGAIALKLMDAADTLSLTELAEYHNIALDQFKYPQWEAVDLSQAELALMPNDSVLTGHRVCFTGKLSLVRSEAQELVVQNGGEVDKSTTRHTTMLVVGDLDIRTFRPGTAFSIKLEKAIALNDSGHKIEIVSEDEFLNKLEVDRELLRMKGVGSGAGKLPHHVREKSLAMSGLNMDYWLWFDSVLKHPDGRFSEGDSCCYCGEGVQRKTPWQARDRGLCSSYCNHLLKSSAKRFWKKHNVVVPNNSDASSDFRAGY